MNTKGVMTELPRITFEFGIDGAALAGKRGAVAVVVDALRATTTIPTMLSRGAVKVIPCESREGVERRREQYPEAKRAGERLCRRIEGYDMGSSPTEIAALDLTGMTILHSTTNGTRVVRAAVDNGAKAVLAGSFATISQTAATALHISHGSIGVRHKASSSKSNGIPTTKNEPTEIALIATGRMKRFAVEDWLGARHIAERIEHLWSQDPTLRRELLKSKGSQWQPPMTPDELWEAVKHSLSVSAIQEAGLDEDIQRCLVYDTLAVAPWFDGEGFVDYWRR